MLNFALICHFHHFGAFHKIPGIPRKTGHFRGKSRRNKTMIKVLFICHGRIRTFVWSGLKSRLLRNENGICTPIVPLFWYFTDLLHRTVLDKNEYDLRWKKFLRGLLFTCIKMSVWMSVKCRFVYDIWLQYILCGCTFNNNRIPYLNMHRNQVDYKEIT